MDVNKMENELFEHVTMHGKECITTMKVIWQHLYGDNIDSIILERYETIEKHLKNLLDDMVKEEQESLDEFRQALSDLILARQTLQEELRMKIDLPSDVDLDKLDVYNQVKRLKNHIEKYEKIRINRLQELISHKDMEEVLCEKLGEEPKYASFSSVPSEEELTEIKKHIEFLNTEKVERLNTCNSLILEIEELIHDLEISDINPERKVALSHDKNVAVSKSRIAMLQEWKAELITLKDIQIQDILVIKEKTIMLWNLLDISAEHRSQILSRTFKECGQTVLNIWMNELEECQDMKRQNIQTVIVRLRDVIKNLWDDCHMNEEERQSFIYYYSDKYDEDLLESHEREEQRLREYYNERKEVFALAKKWFTLWDKMILLENRSSNTNRYANRGGQLLKEERERKAVQKELPKVESSLEKLITVIEGRTQKAFLYNGRPLLERIAELWEQRRAEKENEKETRKIQNQNRITPLKPTNGALTPVIANSAQKTGKMCTNVENRSAKKPIVRRELKMPMSAKKIKPRRSRSHDPTGRYKDGKPQQGNDVVDASIGSYAGFQGYLENMGKSLKSGMPLRSSMSPTLEESERKRTPFFRTPTSVTRSATSKPLTRAFGSTKTLRPMLY